MSEIKFTPALPSGPDDQRELVRQIGVLDVHPHPSIGASRLGIGDDRTGDMSTDYDESLRLVNAFENVGLELPVVGPADRCRRQFGPEDDAYGDLQYGSEGVAPLAVLVDAATAARIDRLNAARRTGSPGASSGATVSKGIRRRTWPNCEERTNAGAITLWRVSRRPCCRRYGGPSPRRFFVWIELPGGNRRRGDATGSRRGGRRVHTPD